MIRQLSGAHTWVVKFVLPAFWLAAGVVPLALPYFGVTPTVAPQHTERLLSTLLWIAMGSLLLWQAVLLKSVSVDRTDLLVSNFRREIRIPLRQIDEVAESALLAGVAEIRFRADTPFGDRVRFLPVRARSFPWGTSPTVAELRELARAGSARTASAEGELSPPASTDQAAAWRHFFFWHRAFWIVMLTYFPGVFAVGMILGRAVGEERGVFAAWILWAIAFLVTSAKTARWPCPQCGQRFFATRGGMPLPVFLVKRCPHCGLTKRTRGSLSAAA